MKKNSLLIAVVFGFYSLGASVALANDVLPKTPPTPKDNPTTPAKVELGKKLYFDPRLSKTGTVSCNSCHNVMAGGEDNTAFSTGIEGKKGGRSAPTVWNAAFMSVQFWDGRAASLEDQAKGPMTNPVEMGMPDHDAVIARLKQIPGYVAEFEKVFGKNALNIDNTAKAIAAYERTLITPSAPFDEFIKGKKTAISAQAQNGYKLVQSIGCTSCHSGATFAGPALPVGTGFFQKFPTYPGSQYDDKYNLTQDQGRFEVTKKDQDRNFYRVPTWRNIALTAPYFHNGSVATLEEAVHVMAKTQLNKDVTTQEVNDIVAFLNTLTGVIPKQTMPVLPPTNGKTLF